MSKFKVMDRETWTPLLAFNAARGGPEFVPDIGDSVSICGQFYKVSEVIYDYILDDDGYCTDINFIVVVSGLDMGYIPS